MRIRWTGATQALVIAVALMGCDACSTPREARKPERPAAPRAPAVDVQAELAAARTAHAQGDVAAERAHLEAAVGADPGAYEARLDLVELLASQGVDVARAGEVLAEAQALHGAPDARSERLRGWVAELRGSDATAAAAYASSLGLADDPELRLRRGLLLQRMGQGDAAVAELQRVRSQRPTDRAARRALAELHEQQGRLGDAEVMLLELAALAPDDPGPQHRLAAFYRRCNWPAKAAEAEARARSLEGPPRVLRPLRPSKR